MIISGTNEEIKMEKLMFKIQDKLMKEAFEKGERINEDELTKQVHNLLNTTLKDISHINVDDHNNLNDKIIEMSKQKSLKDLLDYCKSNKSSLVTNNSGSISLAPCKPMMPTKPIHFKHPLAKPFTPTKKRVILKKTKNITKFQLKKNHKKLRIIRKSIRIMNKNNKTIIINDYGSMIETNLRRSQRLLNKRIINNTIINNNKSVNKRKNNNEETKSNKKVKFEDVIINDVKTETDESEKDDVKNETITMSYSRRLVKKAIARNS